MNSLIRKQMWDKDFQRKFFDVEKKRESLKTIPRKDDHELTHGEDGGMVYKYDLPVVNLPIQFHNKLIALDSETELQTQMEKIFELLECDKDTAYESFMIKF